MPDPRPEDAPDAGTRPSPALPAENSPHTAGTESATGAQAADPGPPTPVAETEPPDRPARGAQAADPGPPAEPGGGIPPSRTPPPGYAGFPPPRRSSAVGRFARHRATHLVAVGLLGVVLGGGIVSMVDHDRGHDRRGGAFERPGHSRMDDRGPARER
ncbi:hypothetical protein SUDANB95_04057 [Actinosynnema sp. ALI-1.44]